MAFFIPSRFKHDVFVTYKEADVPFVFINRLLFALSDKKIKTLKVNEPEVEGDELLPSHGEEIAGSRISLIIFSQHYASSKYCLNQLVKIIDCIGQNAGQIAIPVFYATDRSWVRKQKGSYLYALTKLEGDSSFEKMRKWMECLTVAADLWGLESSNLGTGDELIDAIVTILLQRLNQPCQKTSYESPLHFDCGKVVDKSNIHNLSPKGSFRRNIISWQKVAILGRGSCGTVYKAQTNDGFSFAVKEVCLENEESHTKERIKQLQKEIHLLSRFEHVNIVQYIGMAMENNMLYIFLELVPNGSLQRLYQKNSLKDSQVSGYTRQILSGLKYFHDLRVLHRDLKCANILVDEHEIIKLADFGIAKETILSDAKTIVGTTFWMAPEVVNKKKGQSYGLPADIWSLGCTILEMLTCRHPYFPLNCYEALYKIGKGEPPPIPESLSIDARDFISQCLQANPSKRPTAGELLYHPFVISPHNERKRKRELGN